MWTFADQWYVLRYQQGIEAPAESGQRNMWSGEERNNAIRNSLSSPVFLFILVINIFRSGENVAPETILFSFKEVSVLAMESDVLCWHLHLQRASLHILRNGALIDQRCSDEILRTFVIPYAAGNGDDFILEDDNWRKHPAHSLDNFLFEEGIIRMEWPACSPDTNPIEHV